MCWEKGLEVQRTVATWWSSYPVKILCVSSGGLKMRECVHLMRGLAALAAEVKLWPALTLKVLYNYLMSENEIEKCMFLKTNQVFSLVGL